MKLNLINSSLVFKKAEIVEKTLSKVFSAGDVGSSATVELVLDKLIAPDTPFLLSVSGDHVVASDLWNFFMNNYSLGTLEGFKDEEEYNEGFAVQTIRLSRGTLAAAGTVNFTVKYPYVEKEYPYVDGTLTLSSGSGYVLIELPELYNGYVNILGSNKTGGIVDTTNLKIHLLDANQDEIGTTLTKVFVGDNFVTAYGGGSSYKYVKIDRAGMSGSTTGTMDVRVYYFPES